MFWVEYGICQMICDELLMLSGYAIAVGEARLLLSSSSAFASLAMAAQIEMNLIYLFGDQFVIIL